MTRGTDHRRRLGAVLHLRHYRALWGIVRVFGSPVDALRRYVGSGGQYPWTATLRTPLGPVTVTLPSSHDVRTVNEIFCRGDYGRDGPRVVVDIGANIGISALFFLTRRPDSVVHAYEPVGSNVETLRVNLAPFEGRWHLSQQAVAEQSGEATFLTEPVGRYGGLAAHMAARPGHTAITVECVAIADVLEGVVAQEGRIDLVKIDTEGSEEALVAAIPERLWPHIGRVVFESADGSVRSMRGSSSLA
ncbi:MAG: FkbM family methyltransferase [Mycobacteriaceae bacterium]